MKKTEITRCVPRRGFVAFIRLESERLREGGHISVANNYQSTANSFLRFLRTRHRGDLSAQRLTATVVAEYETWLLAGGLCRNTTSFYLRTLQSAYGKAVRSGLTADRRPFAAVYRGVAKTAKRAIEPEDVCQLKSLDIGMALARMGYYGKRLARLHRQLDFARDIFIFCFCARGLTFADLARLQKSDVCGGVLSYVRRKTRQRIAVSVEPEMQAVMDRHPSSTDYLLPILTKSDGDAAATFQQYRYALGRYNGSLEMLGEMLGGLKLTSYVSRHSWASAAYRRHVPLSVISRSMGHGSERTTEIYLKELECGVIDRANHELISSVFGGDGGGSCVAGGGYGRRS